MKRKQAIILVLVSVVLVQLACSMPQSKPTDVASAFGTPTNGPSVVTATSSLPTLALATQPPAIVTATPASQQPTATATKASSTGSNTGSNTNTNTSSGSCTFQATFVSDVTIPDDSQVNPGAAFTKTWRVRNDGTCTWGPSLALNALAFTGGSHLSGPDQVSLATRVAPGQTVDLSVNLVAPTTPGVYTSEWKFRVDGVSGVGPFIGLGPGKVSPLYARIVVGATPTPTATTASAPRITFADGATGAAVEGSVKAGQTRSYVISAGKGQLMMVSVASSVTNLSLKIVEVSTGTVIAAANSSNTQVYLPSTGDFLIIVIGGSADANFTLGVNVPSRITFDAGATTVSVDGKITGRQAVMYTLRAQSGQTMSVKITSPSNNVGLTIYGIDDGQPRIRAESGASEWSGTLSLTQDYMIMAVPGVDSTTFTLTVTVK